MPFHIRLTHRVSDLAEDMTSARCEINHGTNLREKTYTLLHD
jgi:hypothetical protein